MNKRHDHLKKRQGARYVIGIMFVLAVVSTFIAVLAMRENNKQMIVLRDEVYTADRSNGNVQAALNALQAYVTGHMNTSLSTGPNAVYPPIQLKYTYERLLKAQSGAAGAQLYTQAQKYCEGRNSVDFSGRNRVPCIEQYVQSHSTKQTNIPDALYKFSFVSPKWSPDLAGWMLLLAVTLWAGLVVIAVVRFVGNRLR